MDTRLPDIIKQVLTSWQVIAVLVWFILFTLIISLAARPSRATPPAPAAKGKKAKVKPLKEEKPALDKNVDTSALGLGS